MKPLRHQQRGITFLGWVIILAIVGFFVLLALRLTPVYLENFTLKQQLTSLSEESGVGTLPPVKIRGKLMARLSIDDVENIKPEHVNIKKDKDNVIIDVTYQVITPMVGNIDALVTFKTHKEFKIN